MLRLPIRPRRHVRLVVGSNTSRNYINSASIFSSDGHLHDLFEQSQDNTGTPTDSTLLESLEEETYSSSNSIPDPCSICLEPYKDGDTLLYMPCRHAYHSSCLHKWLASHNTCPVCRHVITPEISSIIITVRFPNACESSKTFTTTQRIGDLINYIRLTASEFGIVTDTLRYDQLAANLNLTLIEAGLDRDLHLDMRRCV